MTKAAIYARISKDVGMTGAAIERQIEDCEQLIGNKGWTLYGAPYVDQSISAYNGKERPAYDRMVRDYKSEKFDVIVAWKIDRLTRSTYDFARTVRELAEQGLRICTTDTGDLNLSTPDGRYLANQFVNFAEMESARKSERIIRANRQRAQKGTMKPGYRLFGYDRQYNIIPEEATVVRSIFDAYLRGSSLNAITKALSGCEDATLPNITPYDTPATIKARELGKEPPSHNKWERTTVFQMLHNPKFAGMVAHIPWQEYKRINARAKWSDYIVRDEDGVPLKATWEPIVDAETWWLVQEKLRAARVSKRSDGTPIRRSNTRKYFGSGLFYCGVCGSPMRVCSGSYRCDGHVSRRHAKVDEFVLEVVRQRLARGDLADLLKRDQGPQVDALDSQMRKYSAEIKRAFSDYRNHLLNGNEYKTIKDEYESKIDVLVREKASLLSENAAYSILDADDPVAAFDSINDPSQIHEIVDALMKVTLLPHERGNKSFDGTDVVIEWKTDLKDS